MQTPGQVHNQNSRLIAILKVLGIYLLTFLLLIWIFANKKVADSNDPNPEYKNQLVKDTADLKKMVYLIDTIAVLTEQLIILDQEELADEGSKKGDIEEIEHYNREFFEEMLRLDNRETLKKDKERLSYVYKVLGRNRGKINSLRKKLADKEKELASKIEEAKKQAEELCETKIELLKSQGSVTNVNLDKTQDEVLDLTGKLSDKDKTIGDLNDKNKLVAGKIKELREYIEVQKTDGSIIKKRKELVETIYQRMLSLEGAAEK